MIRTLKLNRETVRRLDRDGMTQVRGGATIVGCVQSPANSCPVTACVLICGLSKPCKP